MPRSQWQIWCWDCKAELGARLAVAFGQRQRDGSPGPMVYLETSCTACGGVLDLQPVQQDLLGGGGLVIA